MARPVHQLSSSDSEDSLPDLGVPLKPIRPSAGSSYSEPEAVDLTCSSDTEDAAVPGPSSQHSLRSDHEAVDLTMSSDTDTATDDDAMMEKDEREDGSEPDIDEGIQEADNTNQIFNVTDIYEGIEDVNDMGNIIFDEPDMDEGIQEAEDMENCILEATATEERRNEANDVHIISDASDSDDCKEGGTDEETEMDVIVEAVKERRRDDIFSPEHKAPRLSTSEPQDYGLRLFDDLPSFQESWTKAAAKGPQKPRKALTKEEREATRQEKMMEKLRRQEEKEQRAALRKQKAMEKEAQKAKRKEEQYVRKAMKPGECLKLLVVELDRRLVEAPEGGRVLIQLQEVGLACRVVEGRVPASAVFFRVDPLSGKETQADELVVLMKAEDLVTASVKQLHGGGGEGSLCHLCNQWKATQGTPNLALVVCGVDEYFRKQNQERTRQIRSKAQGEGRRLGASSSTKPITRVDLETALVVAQMECRVNHRFLPDGGKVALYIQQVAKAVAELPYKREKGQSNKFSWYAEGSAVNSVKVDRSGVGLFKLWQQQLRQFPKGSVEVAQAVTSKYPSPMALIQAYRRCSSQQEAEQLVADLRVRRGVGPLVSEQRVGKEFSRKLHLFLTSTDPHQSLAANK